MPRHALIAPALVIALALLLSAGGASLAAEPRTPTAAEQRRIDKLLVEASDLIRKEQYAPALDRVEAAGAIVETIDVLNFRGRVLYLLKRDEESRAAYEEARRRHPEPIVARAIADGLALLEARSRGVLVIDVTPAGAVCEIEGAERPLGEGGRVELKKGRYRIALRHDGYLTHEQEVEVIGGEAVNVVVVLGREKEVVRVVEVERQEPVDFGPWSWVSLGLGAVAAGVGTWLVVDGTADWNAVDSDMPKAEAEALVDQGTDKRTGGFVALGVGGALVATAVIMLLLETDGEPAESAGAALGVVPVRGGVGVSLEGAF
ncbi:MAG: hypothetical protein IT385_26775 [Deltaproteobacteria bacterium]|nr:hypothetical protein [Deltaproteobacteria bacterium]